MKTKSCVSSHVFDGLSQEQRSLVIGGKPLDQQNLREIEANVTRVFLRTATNLDAPTTSTQGALQEVSLNGLRGWLQSLDQKSSAGKGKAGSYGDLRQTIKWVMQQKSCPDFNRVVSFLEKETECLEDGYSCVSNPIRPFAHNFEVQRDKETVTYSDSNGDDQEIGFDGLRNLVSKINNEPS